MHDIVDLSRLPPHKYTVATFSIGNGFGPDLREGDWGPRLPNSANILLNGLAWNLQNRSYFCDVTDLHPPLHVQ